MGEEDEEKEEAKKYVKQTDGELTDDPLDHHPFRRKQQLAIGGEEWSSLDLIITVLKDEEKILHQLATKMEPIVSSLQSRKDEGQKIETKLSELSSKIEDLSEKLERIGKKIEK